jgi:hypothetical protein
MEAKKAAIHFPLEKVSEWPSCRENAARAFENAWGAARHESGISLAGRGSYFCVAPPCRFRARGAASFVAGRKANAPGPSGSPRRHPVCFMIRPIEKPFQITC